MKSFLTYGFLLLFMAPSCAVNSQIPIREKQYLIKIYNSTSGEYWTNKWDLSAQPSSWYGVEIENGHVVALNLYRNNLEGKLPLGISHLKNLKIVNLSFNKIKGTVPNDLFELEELVSARLEMNKFSGLCPKIIRK